jgi:hypothetical protein
MPRRTRLTLSALVVGLLLSAETAFAQRPPSGSQGPAQLSLERAWNWLLARPGVIIAVLIIVAAIAYMALTKRKSRT